MKCLPPLHYHHMCLLRERNFMDKLFIRVGKLFYLQFSSCFQLVIKTHRCFICSPVFSIACRQIMGFKRAFVIRNFSFVSRLNRIALANLWEKIAWREKYFLKVHMLFRLGSFPGWRFPIVNKFIIREWEQVGRLKFLFLVPLNLLTINLATMRQIWKDK